MVKIITMHKCSFCQKVYQKPKCLKNHYVKCSVLHNVNMFNCKDELFDLIKDLVKSNNNLTERVKKLECLTYKERKKINVITWLNENKGDMITFERLIEGIEINEKNLELVYDNGIVDALINLIINDLEYNECLYCFEQKSYTLYVKGVDKWYEISNNEFRNKIFYLQRKILKRFREENNIDDLDTDREHNMYNKRLMSICIENFGVKIKNIRNEIYRIRKQNINKLVKYDFEF